MEVHVVEIGHRSFRLQYARAFAFVEEQGQGVSVHSISKSIELHNVALEHDLNHDALDQHFNLLGRITCKFG